VFVSAPGNLGNVSLAILYISVSAFVFAAPWIVARIGEIWAMFWGAACYVVYMGSVIYIVEDVVIATSIVIGLYFTIRSLFLCQTRHPVSRVGFGSAILWVGCGAYLLKCSSAENYGRNSGIFWAIMQFSNILGNLGAYFVFNVSHIYDYSINFSM
jgi:hypothetical protein